MTKYTNEHIRALSRRVLGLSIESDKHKTHEDNLLMQLGIVRERAKKVNEERFRLLKKLNTLVEVLPRSTPEPTIKMEHKKALDTVDNVEFEVINVDPEETLETDKNIGV